MFFSGLLGKRLTKEIREVLKEINILCLTFLTIDLSCK